MAVRVGFHKTLLKMGKWRFGIGYRVKGSSGAVIMLVFALMNLMWYCVLAWFWIMYGFIFLCFILPIKGIIKLCNNKKENANRLEKRPELKASNNITEGDY